MPRVIILQDLADSIGKTLSAHDKTIPLYGRSFPQEDLFQVWGLEAKQGLAKIGEARRNRQGIYLSLQGKKVVWNQVNIIPYQAEYTSRAEGIIDTRLLAKKIVTLIGLGSVGSCMAVYLAQASVGRFRLLDMYTLSASNVSRHACDMHHLGRYKTRAVKDLILARNPSASVETFEEDFLDLAFDSQTERINGSDLVIASTDSTPCHFMVNEACLREHVSSLYVGCYERAQAGEIVFVIPGKTPCFNCLMEFRSKSLGKLKLKSRRIPYTNEDPADFQAEPGLAVDIAYQTVVATAYALALLLPDSPRRLLLDSQRNLILLHSGSQPRDKHAKVFTMPFDFILGRATRSNGCEVCRNLTQEDFENGTAS
jgi:hypothetical protein